MTIKAVWAQPKFSARFSIDLIEAPIITIGPTSFVPVYLSVSCEWGPGLTNFQQRWTLEARKVLSPTKVHPLFSKINADSLQQIPSWLAELLAKAQPHAPDAARS